MANIWLTPERLANLKLEAAAGSARWRALKGICDSNFTTPWDAGPIAYALVYKVTGDINYRDVALSLLRNDIKQGVDAISPDSGYPCRSVLSRCAVVFDWLKDEMLQTDRMTTITVMEAWGWWVWPETNPSRSTAWSINNPGDNYFHGFMMTWMIGLALLGESPRAQGLIDMAVARWNGLLKDYLEQQGEGGYLLEGTNYGAGSMFRIFWYLWAHKTKTGVDLFPARRWTTQAVLCKLHLTTPRKDRIYPGGDQARISSAPLSDYDRSSMLVAMNAFGQPLAGYAKYWLNTISPNRDQFSFTQWEEFLWYDSLVDPMDYTKDLPLTYQCLGAGLLTSRTGWDSSAKQLVFTCGPTREAHQDRAQNGFMLYSNGDWVLGAARLTSHDGLFAETPYHNAITFGAYGQVANQASARVINFKDQKESSTFIGEAGGAYRGLVVVDGSGNKSTLDLCDEYRREILFLKTGVVVVWDRVEALTTNYPVVANFHPKGQPIVAGRGFKCPDGDTYLEGYCVFPLDAKVASTVLTLGDDGADSSYRITTAAKPSALVNIVHVFSTFPLKGIPDTLVVDGKRKITIDNLIVTIDTMATDLPGMTYTGTIPSPPPPMNKLTDNFDDNSRDSTLWKYGALDTFDTTVKVVESNGQLQINPLVNQSGDRYYGYVSVNPYNVTDCYAQVEVVQTALGPNTDTNLTLFLDNKNFFRMVAEGSRLYTQSAVAGQKESYNNLYDPKAMRWWRIRHDAKTDKVSFEVSADGNAWTSMYVVLRKIDITQVKVELSAGTWGPVPSPGTAIFDNFTLQPTTPLELPILKSVEGDIILRGSGFGKEWGRVFLGSQELTPSAWGPTCIVLIIPANISVGDVVVITANGSKSNPVSVTST